MLLKHLHRSTRTWLLSTTQLLVPLLFTILALIVIKTIPGPADSPPLEFGLHRLPDSHVIYSSGLNETGSDLAMSYASSIRDRFPLAHLTYVNNASAEYSQHPDMLRFLVEVGKRGIATYSKHFAIALAVSSSRPLHATALFNNQVRLTFVDYHKLLLC